MKIFLNILILFLAMNNSIGQNTVGLLSYSEEVPSGYYLFTPNNQSTTFLIDDCGEVVNTWTDISIARLGADQYLTPEGDLLIAKSNIELFEGPSIGAGGAGGVIEIRSWDNDLKWQFVIRDSLNRQHHDVHMMPNGNVLAIVWDRYYLDDMIVNGYDTLLNNQVELWPDKIVEIDTATNEIVWQWKAWEHLIQEVDSTKKNFGIVAEHPERIDINYQHYSFDRSDWMHSNAIDYNAELDQILLSVRNFNEIWIIDHSTTTEEAATSQGGNSGMGGDLLYRWGNPAAYDQGDELDRKLWYQHDVSWIVAENSKYEGLISIFNNFIDNNRSEGVILDPYSNGSYQLQNDRFLPESIELIVSHPMPEKQYSSQASNFTVLDNDFFLLHAGRQGRTLVLDSNQNPVREYLIPIRNGVAVDQGVILALSDNFTFSSRFYPSYHPAFSDKDLSEGYYLEANANEAFCTLTNLSEIIPHEPIFYPNPVSGQLYSSNYSGYYRIMDMLGGVILSGEINTGESISLDQISNGLYMLQVEQNILPIVVSR